MPWLRWLFAGLSLQRPGFTPRSVHVGFVVDEVELGQAFLWVIRFSAVNIIPQCLSLPEGWAISPLVAAVQIHCLTPLTWTTTQRYKCLGRDVRCKQVWHFIRRFPFKLYKQFLFLSFHGHSTQVTVYIACQCISAFHTLQSTECFIKSFIYLLNL
jgi:hypothetical protein